MTNDVENVGTASAREDSSFLVSGRQSLSRDGPISASSIALPRDWRRSGSRPRR